MNQNASPQRELSSGDLGTCRRPPVRKAITSLAERIKELEPFPALEQFACDAVNAFAERSITRMNSLKLGKGGLLYPVESLFTFPNCHISGYLALTVDEDHGEVRRDGRRGVVSFQVHSLAWKVFLAAWNAGPNGCDERWLNSCDPHLRTPNVEKSVRRSVMGKIRILGITLELRRPPRLITIE